MGQTSLRRAARIVAWVLVAYAYALTLVAASAGGRASSDAAPRPWLVYRTNAALPADYDCADVPHRLDRLHTFPTGVLPVPRATANDPAWSPNGEQVAFSSGDLECTNGDGIGQWAAQIWVVDSNARNPRAVTKSDPSTGGPLDRSPSWSPDGRRLAFARFDINRGTGGIFVVGTDGRGLRQVSEQRAIALDWSPDGRSIAFVPGDRLVFAESAANRVDVLDIRSRRLRTIRVTKPDDVAWSPDGRLIAVTGVHDVLILDRSLKVVRRISVDVDRRRQLTGVTWAPNGRRIAYSDGSTIFTVGLDGRGVKRVVTGLAPDWRP